MSSNRFNLSSSIVILALAAYSLPIESRAQTTTQDLTLTGTGNNLASDAELTFSSGSVVTANAGSIVDLFHSTLSLPDAMTLKDLKFAGTDNNLLNGASLTLANGSTFTADAGSIINISGANVTFPSIVVLTSGSQILTGKTLVSPIIASITSPSATNLTLSGSNSGASLVLAQGSNANVALSPSGQGVVLINQPNSTSFTLSSRTQITAYPAISVRATTPNAPTAFDIMPHGQPSEVTGSGWSWIDVCDTDVLTNNDPVRTARVAFTSAGAEFGSKAYNGASPAPLLLTVGGTKVLQLSSDNSARFIGPIYGGGSAGYLLDSSISNPSSGLWLGQASPTGSNYAILSGGGDTFVNAPAGSKVRIRNTNVDAINISAVAPSVSSTTGTLVVAGGVGISGSLYGGGTSGYILDAGNIQGSTAGLWLKQSAPNIQNYVLLAGSNGDNFLNAGAGQLLHFRINNSDIGTVSTTGWSVIPGTQSTSTTSGAFQVVGGVGIGGAVNVGGTGIFGGALSTAATTSSTSTTTGALVVAGGFGLAGNQFLGGTLNLPGGGQLSGTSGALALRAGGSNQGVVVTPSGTGSVTIAGPLATSGQLAVTATTVSTSTGTGALVVSGGAAIQKKTNLGDDLILTPTAASAATVRLSGTTVSGAPGVWFSDGGAPTSANVALAGTGTTTVVNGPTGGAISLRVANTPYFTINTSTATLQGVPLSVTATTASISPTTGSATFGGGIGVNGRTSTKTLSVGGGSAVTQILTTISTLNFPSIAANGGVQDLQVSVPGATLGSTVDIVEAGGTFIAPGVLLRAIVTAANIVTVRATNATLAAIDPASTVFRITVLAF